MSSPPSPGVGFFIDAVHWAVGGGGGGFVGGGAVTTTRATVVGVVVVGMVVGEVVVVGGSVILVVVVASLVDVLAEEAVLTFVDFPLPVAAPMTPINTRAATTQAAA